MREIVSRLQENRQLELAKSILESNGYKVSKKSKRLKESKGTWNGMRWRGAPGVKYHANEYYLEDESDGRIGVVYAPDSPQMDGEEGYAAEIIKEDDGDSLAGSPLFKTEEEAKAWVEQYFNKESKKVNESEESGSYSTIRPFKKEDWYGWGGAEKLPSGNDPYIWEDEDYTVLVTGYYDDSTKAQVSIYPDELFDANIDFESDLMEEGEALKLGDQVASELAAGKRAGRLIRQYGFKMVEY